MYGRYSAAVNRIADRILRFAVAVVYGRRKLTFSILLAFTAASRNSDAYAASVAALSSALSSDIGPPLVSCTCKYAHNDRPSVNGTICAKVRGIAAG